MPTRIGFILGALTLTTAVHAQEQPVFGSLGAGQTVRVRTVGGSRFATRLGFGTTDSLRFASAEIPFTAAAVDSLWTRGRATVTGMIVGAAIATPVSFGFLAWVCDFAAEGTGCDEWGTVAAYSLVGGAAGALLGAGVGALIPKWRLRYARDARLTIRPMLDVGRVGVAVRF